MPLNLTSQITSNIIINGHAMDVIHWDCHLNAYGSVGQFKITTSVAKTKEQYPDIFADQRMTADMEVQIRISLDGKSSQLVFGGIVDDINGTWEDDELEITGRDFSAILRDISQTLDKSQYQNQPIGQIITQIAQTNNLTPKVTDTQQLAGVRYNTYQGQEYCFSDRPRPLWNTVQLLAEECGLLAFVNAKKELVFAPEGMSGANHVYYWRPTPSVNKNLQVSQVPIMKLNILQQSRKCDNFTLNVFSYDQDAKQTVSTTYIPPGSDGSGYTKNVRIPNLNGSNIDAVTKSIAESIARRNIVAKLVIEGDPSLNVNDTLQIVESEKDDLLGMSNQPLFIVSLTHQFEMADYGSETAGGFFTHITANQMTGIDTNS